MALTLEEERELEELESQQAQLRTQYESIKKQLTPIEEGPETSMTEAALRSGAQGLTFGFADEASAALESTLTGKPYEKALEESRAEYKASEEEYPVTSLVGEIGGGIGQAIGITAATGGAGAPAAAATGAKTLSNIAKLGKIARAAFIPTVEKSALKNIGTAALSGATYGGLTEIGKSEEEGLGRLKEAPMAALTGGLVGGALGGVLEGGKKAISGSIKLLEDLAKEGELPPSIIKTMDVIKAGTEKKGYITEASKQRVDDALEKAAEDAVDVIESNLSLARQIKQQILRQVDKPIELGNSFSRIAQALTQKADAGFSDAVPVLDQFEKLAKSKLSPESNSLSATSLNDMISILEDVKRSSRDGRQLQTDVRNTLDDGLKELKARIRLQINSAEIQAALDQNPELQQTLSEYVKDIPREKLANSPILTQLEKDIENNIIKLQKKIEKKQSKGKAVKPEKKEKLEKLQQAAASMREDLSGAAKQTTLGELDSVMYKILTASEKLGVKETLTAPSGSAEAQKSKFKIFDVLRGNVADTGTGQKATMRYKEAVQDLSDANAKIGEQFKAVTQPAIKDLENQKFIEGTRLGEGPRDTGALRTFLTAPAVGTALTGNILTQLAKSKAAQTTLRPVTAVLQGVKGKIDDSLVVDPNNPVLKFVSKSLDNALVEKNEARRAAILNTMMQYESIRKLFKEEGYE